MRAGGPPAGRSGVSADLRPMAAPSASRLPPPPLSLYVHWPFCVTKCPYCDFNSHVRARWDDAAWRAALLADLAHEAALTSGYRLASIFFGGGTPSLMPPATVAAVIEAALAHWPGEADLEISLEANPSSAEAQRFADLAQAGVNRISLGLQALDDEALRLLGRPHDLKQGLAALEAAQRAVPRVSIDLIHSRPGQSPAAWEAELGRALGLGVGHLSAYQLTIEPGTRFASLAARGRLGLPGEEEAAAMLETTETRCAGAGLLLYEVSNHARPGEACRHNLQVWRYGAYCGIGPGAHGRRRARATERHRRPEAFLDAIRRCGHGIARDEAVSPGQAAAEALLMGLRLAEGLDPARFAEATGVALADAIDAQARHRLEALGLVQPGERLAVTRAGRALLDSVIAHLWNPGGVAMLGAEQAA